MMRCVLVLAVVAILAAGCEAKNQALPSVAANRVTVSPFQRRMQSYLIRNGSRSKISSKMKRRIQSEESKTQKERKGSFLTTSAPTKELLYRWFGVEGEDPNQLVRCMIRRNEFNNNIHGITNPFLRIQRPDPPTSVSLTTNDRNHRKTVLASNQKTTTGSVEDSWWPSLQISDKHGGWGLFKRRKSHGEFQKQDWRILTYRKRVGKGRACYDKVRDAALDWEFRSADGTTGMMQVPDARPENIPAAAGSRSYSMEFIDETNDTNDHSLYRSLGSRRLVSFASKALLPKKRLYSINPVMVVYDVVDQRGPDGHSTFTSTAYSTLKGHFIRGEERVTVAFRDGSQDVDVEILSISRAGPGLVGKALWPFIGKMQSKFFKQHLDHLSRSGQSTGPATSSMDRDGNDILH
jgi:uncharacterized protein (UPF0548 family)